jgi:hypothetical protein
LRRSCQSRYVAVGDDDDGHSKSLGGIERGLGDVAVSSAARSGSPFLLLQCHLSISTYAFSLCVIQRVTNIKPFDFHSKIKCCPLCSHPLKHPQSFRISAFGEWKLVAHAKCDTSAFHCAITTRATFPKAARQFAASACARVIADAPSSLCLMRELDELL